MFNRIEQLAFQYYEIGRQSIHYENVCSFPVTELRKILRDYLQFNRHTKYPKQININKTCNKEIQTPEKIY